MSDAKKSAGFGMEELMKLRTGTGEHHLESVDLDTLASEFSNLQQKLREQETLISNLKVDAMSDPLTGVANRRTFDKEVTRSLSTSRRYGRQHGLLLIDVDDFKAVNDKLGHVAGDAVLKHIAGIIRQNIRATDIVARIGGDEFAVVLNELKSNANAEMRARAIEEAISRTPCIGNDFSLHIGVSIGHYVFDEHDDLEAIMENADKSMYEQKELRKIPEGPIS